ncbi:hypothetical protein DSM110277_01643 [Sulfitobacter pontiacus]|uniref:Uncharacterized protein n=1 Tax=Sulfitobacter pontiacus TaxID=60137 RepID=A0AAX3ABU8_9RHOB|nr:hypothetical protein DSM110277_01643 [Sulfitobacter pontiacus]
MGWEKETTPEKITGTQNPVVINITRIAYNCQAFSRL